MAKVNLKRVALKHTLGEGARLFDDGQCLGTLVLDGGRVYKVQVDGEHDGSIVLSQVGGHMDGEDFLRRSDRGPAAARVKVSHGKVVKAKRPGMDT